MKRLLSLILSLLLLASCTGGEQEALATPGSEIPGFWTSGQEIEGGGELGELNLRKVDAAISGTETLVSLSFVEGSERAGGTEKPLNDTPAYKIEALDGPGRILVTLKLSHQDFAGAEPEPVGLYIGMMTLPEEEEEGVTRLYFQFTGKVGFKVDEQKGALILHVEPEEPDLDEAYYVSMEYMDALRGVALGNGMHPVLCDDGESRMYLSSPYSDNAQADELAALLNGQLDGMRLIQRAEVVAMRGNWAPTYHANLSLEDLENIGALESPLGEIYTAAPWAIDARFMTWMPDGRGLCAHPVAREESDGVVSYEQLWVYDVEGARTRFIDADFAAVDRASFSPDGRYLAFIERAEAKRYLYLYDTQVKSLDFLAAEGMGDFTAGYAWGADGCLYALSGTTSIQLMRFDPASAGQDAPRVTAVEERYGGAGSVGYAGGYVYINGDVAGTIFQVDPATGERTEFASGDDFSVAPDGRHMLISYYETDGEGGGVDVQTGVKIRDMESGEETLLTSGLTYHGCCWSRDGSLLAYLVGNIEQIDVFRDDDAQSGDAQEYPARLYTYSPGEQGVRLQGMLASDQVYPGLSGDEVVLVGYHRREGGNSVPITYRLKLPQDGQ